MPKRPKSGLRHGLILTCIAGLTACGQAAETAQASISTVNPVPVHAMHTHSLAEVFAQRASDLNPEVLDLALTAHRCAQQLGELPTPASREILSIIDYTLPSTLPRLWVLDLARGEVLFHELVSHGVGTGEDRAWYFSNEEDSRQSSLGLFRAAETYQGKRGYSLRLDGLEYGFNDLARDRAIVVHGAYYNSPRFMRHKGRLGLSWGCPTLDFAVSDQLITEISGGSLLFAYYPDDAWINDSQYLHCGGS